MKKIMLAGFEPLLGFFAKLKTIGLFQIMREDKR
jgi:hypothetical protein